MPDRDEVRAAGGVLWRPAGSSTEVAVVHRPRYDDWSLPKGKLEPGERWVGAAVREVREETGVDAVVGRRLGTTRYRVVQDRVERPKRVRWWALRAAGGTFSATSEVDELRWLPPEEALALVDRDREPLERFLTAPAATSTLLLLRHGHAGSRAEWSGDDDLRPLDALGERQAQAAAEVLPLYAPQRLLAAPVERCTATLRPLAQHCGLDVEPEVSVRAREHGDAPERAVHRVDELVADGRTTVVCSQGEVVPGLVGRLAERHGVEVGRLRAAKGSVWALSFADGRLVDADYTGSLLP